MDNIVKRTDAKLSDALEHFKEQSKKLRTGRAHPSMLEKVVVEAYGQEMPLIQVASVSAADTQLLQVTPFDPNNLEAISNAISSDSSQGFNPSDDGRVIRVPVPSLTEERRQQVVKQLKEEVEKCNISFRNVRHESMKEIDQAEKNKEIGEDEKKRLTKSIDGELTKHKQELELLAKNKENDILKI
ncbi:ribosome recycling factor [Candidatus Saccharibacteria bacterium RIFCSPHIGHO2_12_FULL_41_12]|nr:MAG: ribosome recycling factor [Candidatus Saccharibacteria bacterium RIFCSPHIGHO2_12_FULL_41_12]